MQNVTNKQLGDMIGGIDDKVIHLGKDVVYVRQQLDELKKAVDEANGRQRGDHDKITGLETKLGIWGGAQAMFTTVAAIIAGLIGIQR